MIILGFVKSYLNCLKSVSNLRSFEFAVISFLLGFSSLSLKCNSYFISWTLLSGVLHSRDNLISEGGEGG